MVNQNPQPEIYTTRHSFAATATQGTLVTTQINTNQAYNEEIRIYGIMVNMYTNTVGAAGDTETTATDETFDVSINAGPNLIPSNKFDAGFIHNTTEKTLAFSAPVLVLHRQPLMVNVEWTGTGNPSAAMVVSVTLLGEMYIQED
tara:strand:- start:96 stop:530 length:435 start_codon:yes stop_codon:yes gene_type:complete